MNLDHQKQQIAKHAIKLIKPDMIVGIGTGSTVKYFIDELAPMRHQLRAVVSSSEQSTKQLLELGFEVEDLNNLDHIDIYIDGADEINPLKQMIKGGGAALTREKIIATASRHFVCLVDDSKFVKALGKFPVPVEVIPMARSFVAREIVKLGGLPEYRQGVITDNGNVILDIHHLDLTNAKEMENIITAIAGVVTCGIFANRCADEVVTSSL